MKSLVVFFLSILLPVSFALAQGPSYPNPLNVGGVTVSTIPQFLAAALGLAVIFLTPIVILMVMYTGYLFVTAQGDEGKIKKARAAFLWTIIGAAVVFGAQVMAIIIRDTITQLNTGF